MEKQLQQYNLQYQDLLGQHNSAVNRLPSLRGREKRQTKRAIRQLNRQIRKLLRLIKETQNEIRKNEKIETQQILANQGIDSKANIANAIATSTADVVKTGVKAFTSMRQRTTNGSGSNADNDKPIEPNYILYGAIALVGYMMLKKK